MWRIFDEIERMRRRIERMISEFYEEFEKPMWDFETRSLEPLVSVKELEDKIIVIADLPCVDKNNIRIYATEDTLTIEAALKETYKFERLGITRREATFEYFRKVIQLPAPVIPERAKAKFRKGILEVILPKKIRGVEIRVE
mgnify:CR=1 FL=1